MGQLFDSGQGEWAIPCRMHSAEKAAPAMRTRALAMLIMKAGPSLICKQLTSPGFREGVSHLAVPPMQPREFLVLHLVSELA
jgi:hypothetical protein